MEVRLFPGLRRAVLGVVIVLALAPGAWAAPRPWDVLRHDTPLVVWAGIFQTVSITVQNTGRETWSEPSGDHLAYHWRSPSGAVVEWDGERTILPKTVPPGEWVDLDARVQAPAHSGVFAVEWEMVREHVGWYGPPAGGVPLRVKVLVLPRYAVLQVLFFAAVLGAAIVVRRRQAQGGFVAWVGRAGLPVLLTWVGIALATLCFSELSAHQLWDDAWPMVLGAAALLSLPVAVLPVGPRPWVAVGMLTAVTLLTVADLAYMRFFGSLLPVVAAVAVGQVGQIEGSVFALLRPTDLWLFPALAGLLCSAVLLARTPTAVPPKKSLRLVSRWGGAAVCALAGLPVVTTLSGAIQDPAFADQLFSQEILVSEWGLGSAHLFDVARTMREWWRSERPQEQDRRRVSAFVSARPAGASRSHPLSGVAKSSSLVLVQVESLQEWVVFAEVGGVKVMPHLSELTSRGLVFTNVFDQTGQGRSSDGEFITLNSLHALDRGAVVFRRPNNDFLALPEVLRRHGYATLSAHPFIRGFWNRAVLHPKYGFDRMLFRRELGSGEVIGWGLADEPFFARVLPELKRLPQPFMAFLITLGLHHPFDQFPESHKELDVGELADTPLGNYLHAMHYFDASFAKLLAGLDSAGGLENTLVAVYGDHESGLQIDANELRLAGLKKWDPSVPVRLQKVPLIVLLPHRAAVGEVATVGGQIDIAPTLLTYLGIEPPRSFLGRPIDGEKEGFAVLCSGSAVSSDRMFAATGPGVGPDGMCFDFPTGAPRATSDCRQLATRGREELEVSRWVVLHDQVKWLEGGFGATKGGDGP